MLTKTGFAKLILTFILLTSEMAFSSPNSVQIMKETAKLSDNYVSEGGTLKNGVSFSLIKRTPKFSKSLVKKIQQLEKESISNYISVLKEGEADLDCTLKDALEDIRLCLPEGAVQIGERYAAMLNGQVVGYALMLYDNADASIIQDGSWIVIYLDVDMNVVAVYTGTA